MPFLHFAHQNKQFVFDNDQHENFLIIDPAQELVQYFGQ